MRAESVAGLHHAFRNWTDRVNNYAVGDVEGNFGYLHEGLIPVRGEANGWRAVPGWSGDHEWDGYIPHDELPKAINPECGYTVTCNQRVAAHDYPYYVGLNFSHDFRAPPRAVAPARPAARGRRHRRHGGHPRRHDLQSRPRLPRGAGFRRRAGGPRRRGRGCSHGLGRPAPTATRRRPPFTRR